MRSLRYYSFALLNPSYATRISELFNFLSVGGDGLEPPTLSV
jgi:hypothetical protein